MTVKVQNFIECLSRWYLLNCRIFCYQTWYGDATSWAWMSCKKICLLSSSSRSQWELIRSKYDSFYYIFWPVDSLTTKLGLMVHYHKPECLVKRIGLLLSRSRSPLMFKMSVNVCPHDILKTAKHFVTKLDILMHHHEPQSHAKLLFSRSRSQEGLIWSKCMTVSSASSELPILLLLNLDSWYIIIGQSVLWRNWIAMFKVKVRAKLHNVNECLSRHYLLNCWTFYYQTFGWLSSRSRSQWRIM